MFFTYAWWWWIVGLRCLDLNWLVLNNARLKDQSFQDTCVSFSLWALSHIRQNKIFIRCCRERNNELKMIKPLRIKRLDSRRRQHVEVHADSCRMMIWLQKNSLGDWSSRCDRNPPIAGQQWHIKRTRSKRRDLYRGAYTLPNRTYQFH